MSVLLRALADAMTDAEGEALVDKAFPPDEPGRGMREHEHTLHETKEAPMTNTTELAARALGYADAGEMLVAEAWARHCGTTPTRRQTSEELRAFADEQELIVRLEREQEATERKFGEQAAREEAEEDRVYAELTRKMFPDVVLAGRS